MSYLKDITGSAGNELAGRKIALCITASVSITEAPRIARELMRHGAEVIPLLTEEAAELVSPMIFEWSTGNEPITKITGKVEHVKLVKSREDRVDAIVVAPCTANSLAKFASGIADDPVSTLVCTALGTEIRILIAPAMHEPMIQNPAIRDSVEKLEKIGVVFVRGKVEESKSKIATPEDVFAALISLLRIPRQEDSGESDASDELESIGILVTAGPTREALDQVRFITNASSGKMGIALAQASAKRGAKEICLVSGPGVALPVDFNRHAIKVRSVVSTEDMLNAVMDELSTGKYDVLISAAAPADYAPSSPTRGKIGTENEQSLKLELKPTRKIIQVAKEMYPNTFVAAFKAEYGLSKEELVKKARESLARSHADVVIANDVGIEGIGFGADDNEVFIVSQTDAKHLEKAPKEVIASGILDYITSRELVTF